MLIHIRRCGSCLFTIKVQELRLNLAAIHIEQIFEEPIIKMKSFFCAESRFCYSFQQAFSFFSYEKGLF